MARQPAGAVLLFADGSGHGRRRLRPRALRFGAAERRAAGVSCTASLATDRPKRGPHRVHVALQTMARTRHCWLVLDKYVRNRRDEESIVARLLLNAVAEALGVEEQLGVAAVAARAVGNRGDGCAAAMAGSFHGTAPRTHGPRRRGEVTALILDGSAKE